MMTNSKVTNPDSIECTIEMTMTIREWKCIRDTLQKNAACLEQQVIMEISDLVEKMGKTFYAGINS